MQFNPTLRKNSVVKMNAGSKNTKFKVIKNLFQKMSVVYTTDHFSNVTGTWLRINLIITNGNLTFNNFSSQPLGYY